jgi:Protein kinase domain
MSTVETAGVISAAVNPIRSSFQDASDQLDFPSASLATKPNHDDDFDTFKADAQVIVDDEISQEIGTISELNNQVATDSSHAPSEDAPHDVLASIAPVYSGHGRPRFVSPKDFELLKVIGMGAFGKVVQVRNKRSQHILAMKIISKRLLYKKGSSMIENVLIERNILQRIGSHPFIVTMHCSFQTREKLFIIMDFLAGGELFLRLGREGIFLEKTVRITCFSYTIQLHPISRSVPAGGVLLGRNYSGY